MITTDGPAVLAQTPAGSARHVFASPAEAQARAAFVGEALTWTGTPFAHCADIKGQAVDCAMLMTRCAVDTGLIAPFDPRPYEPRWHIHRDRELFLEFLTDRLGAVETDAPRFGDVAVWRFGRTFSHGAIIVSDVEVVHSWWANRMVLTSRRDEPYLSQEMVFSSVRPRAVRYFDLWSARFSGERT